MASRTSRKESRAVLDRLIDKQVHAGAFLRNRALLAVARAARSDRLTEPLQGLGHAVPIPSVIGVSPSSVLAELPLSISKPSSVPPYGSDGPSPIQTFTAQTKGRHGEN